MVNGWVGFECVDKDCVGDGKVCSGMVAIDGCTTCCGRGSNGSEWSIVIVM